MKTYRCANCGYRSGCADFFRQPPGDSRGPRRHWCSGCAMAVSVSPWFVAVRPLVGGLIFAAGLVLSLWLEPLGFTLMFAGGMLAVSLPTGIIHEFGHAFAARAGGAYVASIDIGSGDILAIRQWLGTPIQFRSLLPVGMTTSYVWPTGGGGGWAGVAACLGGVAANLATMLVLAPAVWFIGDLDDHGVLEILLASLLLGSFMDMVFNLWPGSDRTRDLASDGLQLIRHLRAWRTPGESGGDSLIARLKAARACKDGRHDEALRQYGRAWSLDPRPDVIGGLLAALRRVKGPQAALAHARHHHPALLAGGALEQDWADARMQIAWAALEGGAPADAPLADRLSRLTLEADPLGGLARCMRGAVLKAQGTSAEGHAFLWGGFRDLTSNEDRIELAPRVARSFRERGETAVAAEYEALGVYLATQRSKS